MTYRRKDAVTYTLTSAKNGVNELIAVNDHEFLAVERDGNAGVAAAFKQIMHVDLTGATDVSAIDSLPTSGLPAGVVPVTKTVLLDMLDPAFGLAGATFPEKIEGLAWAPDLADGRHVLLITNDNDLNAAAPNSVFAFAIETNVLPGQQKQILSPNVRIRPDVLKKGSHDDVRVVILSDGLFDASAVDRSSLKLAGARVSRDCHGTADCHLEDTNRDGRNDLVCEINGRQLSLKKGDTSLTLEGVTKTGSPVRSEAAVKVK